MEKVAIATNHNPKIIDENGKEISLGYWALGAHWSTQAKTLEIVESPSDELTNDLTQVNIPDAVRRFHQRATLMANGKIAREDVYRAKQDPRLIVIGAEDISVPQLEIMTQEKIEARVDPKRGGR